VTDRVADVLANIVRSYGPDIGSDPRRVRALLSDLAGDAPRKIDVLVAAAELGAPSEIRSWTSGADEARSVPQLVSRLVADGTMDSATALWALQGWAFALGVEPRSSALAQDPGTIRLTGSTEPSGSATPTALVDPAPPGDSARSGRPLGSRRGLVATTVAALLVAAIVGGVLLFSRGGRGASTTSSGVGVTTTSGAATTSSLAATTTSVVATTTSVAVTTSTTLVAIGPAVVDPKGSQIQQTLEVYFSGINSKNYPAAWNMFTPGEQARESLAAFSSEDRVDSSIGIDRIAASSGGSATVVIHFESQQIPQFSPTHQSCNRWAGDFILVDEPAGWRIDRSTVRASSC